MNYDQDIKKMKDDITRLKTQKNIKIKVCKKLLSEEKYKDFEIKCSEISDICITINNLNDQIAEIIE